MEHISNQIGNLTLSSNSTKLNGNGQQTAEPSMHAQSDTTAGKTGNSARFEAMMTQLWEALIAHWGHAFITRFGAQWRTEKTWQSEMRGLTKNQILAGLEVCKYDERFTEWPPAARVFRAIAIRQPLRAGGASAETVWRNICDFYAQTRPAEAVWIIQHAESWEALRKGTDAAQREFYRLWHEMLAFVADGGQLPEPIKPAPRIDHKRERKPPSSSYWAELREMLGVSA